MSGQARDQQTGRFVIDGDPAEGWKIVPVAMRQPEKDSIKKLCKDQGVSVSAWCRETLLKAVEAAD